MKKISNIFLFVLLVSFILPSVALASWWNPFTWNIFNISNIQTSILENRIKEIENKLNITATSTSKNTTVNTPANTAVIKDKGIVKKTEIITKDVTPYINLKVNNQDGPVTVDMNSYVTASWVSEGVVSCSGSINSKPLYGSETIYIDSGTTSPFTIRCLTPNGAIVSDSVILNINGNSFGDTDPYNVSSDSGNAYSPDQLNAIDCAYYGTGCPTINVRILNN